MDIRFREEEDGVTVVRLLGRLDTESSPEAETELLARLPANGRWLMNLEELEFVSSAGLRVFLLLAREARKNGTRLALSSLRPSVRAVFRISGFDTLFSIAGDRAEAELLLH